MSPGRMNDGVPRTPFRRSATAQHEHDVPAEDLAQTRQRGDPGGPPRVVARERRDDLDVRAGARPAQRRADRHREQRAAEAVLRLTADAAPVPPAGPLATEVVPGRGLVAAPRREPRREGEEERAPGPGDP